MHRPQRILLYGINYAPEMLGVGRYSGELGAYLANNGFDVKVITAPPHYPGWRVKPPYGCFSFRNENIDNALVTRCPLLVFSNVRGWKRALIPLLFALFSGPVALWRILSWRPDVVLVVEPTLFVAPIALFGAWLIGAKTALHVQDLEIDAAFAMQHLGGGRVKHFAIWAERLLMRSFSKIITISQEMRLRLIGKGVSEGDVSVIRNWVDSALIYPMGEKNSYFEVLSIPDNSFVALYSGNIGPKQALDVVLLAAAHVAKKRPDVIFVIAGEGPEKARLVQEFGQAANVRFLPTQPNQMLCELLNLADVHILSQDRGAAGLVLPSKLGGMLASGRRIVATADPGTELYEFLQGVATLVPPGDVELFADGILACAERGKLAPSVSADHLAVLQANNNLKQFADEMKMLGDYRN